MALSSDDLFRNRDGKRILIYYFAFPHYRISVLQELQKRFGNRIELLSGSQSRGGLQPLAKDQLPELQVYRSKRIGPFSWERGLIRKVISDRYSIVVLAPATSSLSTWAVLTIRRLFSRTTFLWGQCGKPDDKSTKRLLQELMNRLASGLLVYGSLEEAGATQCGTPVKKVQRVSNAVPLRPVTFTSAQLGRHIKKAVSDATDHGVLRLVYVGRLNAEKNIDILLQAGELLKKKFSKLSICLIGDGPDKSRLREMYPDLSYKFRGAVYDRKELEKEILAATFVVSPSTMGLLALDALSAGVPVLIPDHPRNGSEVRALTHHVNGFHFKHDDPRKLADQVDVALKKLAALNMDYYFLEREKGLEAWSPERVAENIHTAIMSHKNKERQYGKS